MKTNNYKFTIINRMKGFSHGLVIGFAVFFSHNNSKAGAAPVDLGGAAGFGILSGTGITNTGQTSIIGDIGTFPTPAITGLGSITLTGTNHSNDLLTQLGKTDLATAYNDAFGRTPSTTYGPVFDLGGLYLSSGVYRDPSSFGLTGTLTLDAHGDSNAVWIFQAGSTLVTASNSVVDLINGAQSKNVFWQVGSSATFGTYSDFAGNVMALTSITMTTGANIDGALYALNGAVTLDTNNIKNSNNLSAVPEPGSALLLICGIGFILRRRHRLN